MSTPILNPLLAVSGVQNLISRAQAQMDWGLLQRFLGANITTLGIDPAGNGADPTGLQDATATIQQILNTQVAAGFMVALYIRPNAIYKISSALVLPDSMQVFIYGGGILKLANGANCNLLESGVVGCNFAIHDITFAAGTGSLSGIYLKAGGSSLIDGCQFTGFTVAGVDVKPAAGHLVSGLTISDNNFSGDTVADINLDSTDGAVTQILIEGNELNSAVPLATTIVNTLTYTARGNNGSQAPLYDASYDWPIPQAVAYTVTNQALTGGTPAALVFDATFVNRGAIWANANPTRFTAPVAGTYRAVGQVAVAAIAVGSYVQLSIYGNGAALSPNTEVRSYTPTAAAYPVVQVTSGPLQMAAGDYVEFVALHGTGGNLNTVPSVTWGSLQLQTIP